jgi:hypothetical protein
MTAHQSLRADGVENLTKGPEMQQLVMRISQANSVPDYVSASAPT